MTLADVRNWLKSFDIAEHYYIGKLDNKQDKSLGVYSLKSNTPPVTAIGCVSTYDIMGVSLLLHYNNNANETEIVARKLYDFLLSTKNTQINNIPVYMIKLLQPEPVDVGTDEKGVYEWVIEMKIYFERK